MAEKLLEYNQKRNFAVTPEPKGHKEAPESGLRFVVQHHLARRDHFDLRLEWDGALLSWAVPKGPSFHSKDKRLAVMVEDHPLEYRHFEGTIPKGEYGGGTVMLWDEGYWEPYGDVAEGLRAGSLKFTLYGKRLRGKWALIRMKPKENEPDKNWLLLKEKDSYVKQDDGISAFTTSIRTGRTMEEIEKGVGEKITRNPFQQAEPQLAKLVTKAPEGEDWLYELKYDGYRMMAFIEAGGARLMTRNNNDFTNRFPLMAESLSDWAAGQALVVDGEMVVTDEQGKTDFQALQNYLRSRKGKNLTYILFDLLAYNGEDLRNRPLIERKALLETLMANAPENIYYSRHTKGNGAESFAAACQLGMEGIIGKKAHSPYRGLRNGDWIKIKCLRKQAFVIGGYTRTEKKASGISALLLGVYENEAFVYVGRVGTGFTEAERQALEAKCEPLKRPDAPYKVAPKARSNETITWVEPKLVAEVQFAEWTEEHLLRHASFQGLKDVPPKTIQREPPVSDEQPDKPEEPMAINDSKLVIEGVKISSPDKVIFENPPITKENVVRYYATVAERMLPYVRRRVLSIVRCPKGVSEACFYKKHPGPSSKGVITLPVTNSEGKTEEYFYLEDTPGLVSEAQMGTLEFHTWGSRVDELEKPDMMVFDLDPDEGMELATVRQGVRDLKSILESLSLHSYLKTSGGKGYHVVVPFVPSVSWEAFHNFAKRVAEVMENQWPDRYITNVRKVKRAGKIFIDWIRNGRGATSVAPYSLRARTGAKVSMPITWEELDEVAPDGISLVDALERIQNPDPWEGFFAHSQKLK
jgi:bifunctional non-homologous end joining protein LigD